MVKVKSPTVAKTNYEQSTTLVRKRYEDGVSGATWKDAAIAGQDLYAEQMMKAEILERRRKGIDKISDEAWRNAAKNKGALVIAQRMKEASGKWANEWAPYGDTLSGLQLPPRTADGEQNVLNRVVPVVKALESKKKEIKG